MSIVPRLLWPCVALLAMSMPLTLVHAQTDGVHMVASEEARDSFWVKRASTNPAFGTHRVASPAGKSGVKAHDSGASEVATPDTNEAKINKSIATELAGSKSVPWSIVVGLTLLTLLPALLLSMTPLVRLLVVFHFLRQALGTQTAPSNQVLMGLALMMTWFLMQPVLLEVEQKAVTPYSVGTITGLRLWTLEWRR